MTKPRIIAGKAGGRRLLSVPGDSTRPITDRTKESLFNIIGTDIEGASFLDLFAGTGSVGLEALSRGARFVRFLDNNHRAIKTIQANLEITGLAHDSDPSIAEILHRNAFSYLKSKADRSFDYIYIAPPQYKSLWEKTIKVLVHHPDWMDKHAWVIVQIHPVEYKEIYSDILNLIDRRKYGSTLLIFYERLKPSSMR